MFPIKEDLRLNNLIYRVRAIITPSTREAIFDYPMPGAPGRALLVGESLEMSLAWAIELRVFHVIYK